MLYDENTGNLVEPILSGNRLEYKNPRTGNIQVANDEQTLVMHGVTSNVSVQDKYRNTVKTTAHNPVNPRIRLDNGCPICGRLVVSYQRLGERQQVVYVCLCGAYW